MSKQFFPPGDLSAECVQVSVNCHVNIRPALGQGAGSEAPRGLRSSKCYKLVFGYVTVVTGTHLILLVFK